MSGQAKTRVGHGQADVSRSKGRGALGLTNKDKLKLGKAAAKNLVEGTMETNKAKRKKAKGQQPFLSTR